MRQLKNGAWLLLNRFIFHGVGPISHGCYLSDRPKPRELSPSGKKKKHFFGREQTYTLLSHSAASHTHYSYLY